MPIEVTIVDSGRGVHAIELVDGLDIEMVCYGGANPDPHIGWDASSPVSVWSGTTDSVLTATVNTVYPGTGPHGFDVQIVGVIGDQLVHANVVVAGRAPVADTCTFLGNATVTTSFVAP